MLQSPEQKYSPNTAPTNAYTPSSRPTRRWNKPRSGARWSSRATCRARNRCSLTDASKARSIFPTIASRSAATESSRPTSRPMTSSSWQGAGQRRVRRSTGRAQRRRTRRRRDHAPHQHRRGRDPEGGVEVRNPKRKTRKTRPRPEQARSAQGCGCGCGHRTIQRGLNSKSESGTTMEGPAIHRSGPGIAPGAPSFSILALYFFGLKSSDAEFMQ